MPFPYIFAYFSRAPLMVKLSIFWLSFLTFLAIFGGYLTPYDYEIDMDLMARLTPPIPFDGSSWAHPLGTDDLGRDIFSRLLISIRVTLVIAGLGTFIGALVGTTIGFITAHFKDKFGGIIDEGISTVIDIQASLPFIILALGMLGIWGNSIVLLIVLMSIFGWERYARLSRNLALSASSMGYAKSAVTLGASPVRIHLRHILPNIASVLIVNMTLNFPSTVLLETSLSFLGVGVQPPLSSLGTMLSFGREHISTAWWISFAPGITIFISTLSMCLLGDWLRDTLDPHEQ